MKNSYDSRPDTIKHILRVRELLEVVEENLMKRAHRHDASKIAAPEREFYDTFTPKLHGVTYGSAEYAQLLKEMKPALTHHYAANDHHPEHFVLGINGMNLLQLLEMLTDWVASVERHKDGDLKRSLPVNQRRYAMSDELVRILYNTAVELGWLDPYA